MGSARVAFAFAQIYTPQKNVSVCLFGSGLSLYRSLPHKLSVLSSLQYLFTSPKRGKDRKMGLRVLVLFCT